MGLPNLHKVAVGVISCFVIGQVAGENATSPKASVATPPVVQSPPASAAKPPVVQSPPASAAKPPVVQSPPASAAKPPILQANASDLNPNGPCKVALSHFCSHVRPGNAKLAFCLRRQSRAAKQRQEEALTQPCTVELRDFFANKLHSGELEEPVEGLKEACASEIAEHCPGKTGHLLTLCLKAQRREKNLKAACMQKMFKVQAEEARNIALDVAVWMACKTDLDTVPACRDLPKDAPPGARKACLINNRKSLSINCLEQLFIREQADHSDVRLTAVKQACQAAASKYCVNVATGEARILKCLWEHRDKDDVSEECKKQVLEFTKRSFEDYRLDYRIRTRCEKDISKFCAEEQRFVDRLPASELFGNHWQEGKSGKVLQCLKANYAKIQGSDCKPEITRMVRVHAEAPNTDPIFGRKCEVDVKQFCSKTPPERLHLCLRTHIHELSRECRGVEIVQGSLSAMDISMKPQMRRRCAETIQKSCSGVAHGDAQLIQCLQDHLKDDGMGSACRKVVEKDLEASNHDWRLKWGIHQNCMLDANRLCKEEVPKAAGAVLSCLKKKHSDIQGTACQAEMRRFMQQGASNIRFAPGTYAACVEDVSKFCGDIQPGQGRVHECLMEHKQDLSRSCGKTEFQEHLITAEDIRLHPKASRLCKSSLEKLCPDVAHGRGRKWQCLSGKKDATQMAPACRAIVTAHERLQNFEFHLNPQLAKHCSKDAARLCPFEAALASNEDFKSEGIAITCLIKNKKEVQNLDCQALLWKRVTQRLARLDNDPEAVSYCDEDIMEFCRDVQSEGHGEVHQCLQEHGKQLSHNCYMVEESNMQLATEDHRAMLFMEKECQAAKKRYCDDVVEGGGHVAACMLLSMHDRRMEPGCKKRLEKVQSAWAKSFSFNPLLASECEKDLETIQRNHSTDHSCKLVVDQDAALSSLGIRCLKDHSKEIKHDGCKKALRVVKVQQSYDIRSFDILWRTCQGAIKTHCGDVEAGNGRVHSCLRKNVNNIDQECATMVKKLLKAEQKDVTLNPRVRGRCKNEMHAFCKGVEAGESRLNVCLRLHQNASGFSAGCRDALLQLGLNHSVPVVGLSQPQAKSLLDAILLHRSFWDKWGLALVGGVALLLVVWTVIVVAFVRWLRKRVGYGVHVDMPEQEERPQPA